jgi:excisionase family DNA binding protein
MDRTSTTMLTVRQASSRLNLSVSLVYDLCRQGLISHYRCGLGRGTIRIDENALEAYLDRSKMIVQARPQGLGKSFSQLDSARLAKAWAQQGVV